MVTSILLPDKNHCCGCGVCSLKCKLKLIKMNYDEEGFIYPEINYENCIKCNECINSCPILNIQNIQINTHNKSVYAGFFNNINELLSSTSGGVATAISRKIINEGGVVYGVTYNNDFTKSEYQKAETIDELEKFRGSKYIQAIKDEIYLDVKKSLSKNLAVLFIGLPCDIGALKSYLKIDYDNLYTCELICYGPTSEKVAQEYTKTITKKYNSNITEFSVRYKQNGWTPPYLRAVFENGDVLSKPFYDTDYGYAFSIFTRPSCYNCVYKGDNRVADITVGDFWGCTTNDNFWNENGVSVIFVHTINGKKLLYNLDNFELVETTYAKASDSNKMIFELRIKSKIRDKFSEHLIHNGLIDACNSTRSLKYICIKNINKCIPESIKPFVIKIYNYINR